MINTAPRTRTSVAFVTDHGRDGVADLWVNVYQDGHRLDYVRIPGSQWMDKDNALAFAAAWLGNQGYTLVSEFVNRPFADDSLIGCDYRVSLEW